MDEDNINTLYFEEKIYQKWVNEKKNQILNMTDTAKKQRAWNELFPPFVHDESYLLGNLF